MKNILINLRNLYYQELCGCTAHTQASLPGIPIELFAQTLKLLPYPIVSTCNQHPNKTHILVNKEFVKKRPIYEK